MSRLQNEIECAIKDGKREIILKGEGDEDELQGTGKLPESLFDLTLLNFLDVTNLPGLLS